MLDSGYKILVDQNNYTIRFKQEHKVTVLEKQSNVTDEKCTYVPDDADASWISGNV